MTPEPAAFRLDGVIWAIVAGIAAIVLAAPLLSSFRIAWDSFMGPAIAWLVLVGGAWFYRRRRHDPKLATALTGTAQILAFSAVAAPLSYLAASAGLPLQDGLFDAWDRALVVDWQSLLTWMNRQALLHPVFWYAYGSFTLQASTTVLMLAFSGRHLRLKTFTLAFMLTAVVTIAISAVLPAQGIWGHYGLTPADHPAISPATRELHLATFHGLRDGSFRLLMGVGSEGIITFPSLHAALAVIFILALWPVPILCWLGVTVNVLMIIATPVDGGHYVIDVIAGVVLAIPCWMAAQTLTGSTERPAFAGGFLRRVS